MSLAAEYLIAGVHAGIPVQNTSFEYFAGLTLTDNFLCSASYRYIFICIGPQTGQVGGCRDNSFSGRVDALPLAVHFFQRFAVIAVRQ